MKNIVLFLFFLILNISLYASNEVDSLLKVLDTTINERKQYDERKELNIRKIRTQLRETTQNEERYYIYRNLLSEYRNYNMDSALQIANERLAVSERMGNQRHINSSNMNIAEIMGIMGMYKESLDILNSIRSHELEKAQRANYYHLYHSIYTLMFENSFSQKEKQYYEERIYQYKDSLLSINDPYSLGYHLVENGKLVKMGEYDKALSIMRRCYEENKHDDSRLGMLSYGLSDIYNKLGDKEQEKKYLIISAIADLRMGVKEYIALHKLAILLYQEGDVDRAYTYIKRSMEDALFCKAHYRMLEISKMLPIIISAYDLKMKQEKEKLRIYLIVITILSFMLIVAVILVYRQLSKVYAAREAIRRINEELRTMNENLTTANNKLWESNHVKKEYIGYVFNLCSAYINKLDSYRKNINRKIKLKQIEEVSQITSSLSLVSDELREFFHNFDTIFMDLYPNFITDFNALLTEKERLIPKDDEILTPELRIFALVRLGINDSTKIAKFLHYSPQTVYNYRLRIRNKSTLSKDDFLLAVQQIGRKS